MNDKERQIEDLLSEIISNATAVKIVFDDMLLNDMDNAYNRVYMGLTFCERLLEAAKSASAVLQ